MSALSALLLYSSDSDSGDDTAEVSLQHIPSKKARLPAPLLTVSTPLTEQHCDEPAKHGGRVRSFPHERGNWPTFVYVPCVGAELLNRFIEESRRRCPLLQDFKPCGEPHISLSRTTVLRYHWITTFTTTLRDSFREFECEELELSTVKVYCNDEETRSFVALEVNPVGCQQLKKITDKVDSALQEFKLPKYYLEPSFHVSVLWCHGNKLLELGTLLQPMQDSLAACSKGPAYMYIEKIICKSGNKLFQFPLKY